MQIRNNKSSKKSYRDENIRFNQQSNLIIIFPFFLWKHDFQNNEISNKIFSE